MESALNTFNNKVSSIPMYGTATGILEDKMGERFSTKDPFFEKIPKRDPSTLRKGEKMEYREVRRRPPPNITEQQRKLWKRIMKRAWYHDRNFCGCTPFSLGLGMISIVSIFPIIGSLIAYKMHYKMIKMCHQAGCPAKLEAIMVGNIGVDFAMTLIPLLGVLLSWMKASSTRNAALFDTWLRQESDKHNTLTQTQNDRNQKLAQQVSSQNQQVQSPQRAAQQAPTTRTAETTQLRSTQQTNHSARTPANVHSQAASQTGNAQRANTQAASQPRQQPVQAANPPVRAISQSPTGSAKRKPVPSAAPPAMAPPAPPKVPLHASSQPYHASAAPALPSQVSAYSQPSRKAPRVPRHAPPAPPAQSYYTTESAADRPYYPPPAGTYYNVEYA